MKKLILRNLFGLFSLVFLSVTLVQASALYVDSKTSESTKSVILDLSQLYASQVSLKIIDEEGVIQFSDQISVRPVGLKSFNLENLPDGEYTFVIDDLMQVLKYHVNLSGNEAQLSNSPSITYKPTVWVSNKRKVDFHLVAGGKNVDVQLLDESGRQLYYRDYEDQQTISKRIDMNQLKPGKYTMKVEIDDETFYKFLYI